MQQAYENSQGIHDYIAQEINECSTVDIGTKRPLSSVALHDAEDICTGSKLYNVIKVFADKKVFTHYGLNLLDYLELPHDLADFIITDCDKRMQREFSTANEVLDELSSNQKK